MPRALANSVSKGFNAAGGINPARKHISAHLKAMLIISINKI